ncbi:MAG: beta-N-acetylglucosaminidase domain-containing protein, partial [Lentisphaeraceae bacterium]|nr:beta-N-acetylglucosaminidase domain-containing protein [Lentisphaeraceae bacterium]
RNAFIWWNWPVSDYVRYHLILGRTYGLDKKNKGTYGGLTANPMDKPEASKIALFGVGDYTWNIEGFNSHKSWKDGIKRLFPTIAKEMQTFANHNSDQGQNNHGYRREESVAIKPVIDAALKQLESTGMLDAETTSKLAAEFKAITKSGKILRAKLPKINPALFAEIENWLVCFEALGQAGSAAVKLLSEESSSLQKVKLINIILKRFAEMEVASVRQKIKGQPDTWARGCQVSSLVLTPFIKSCLSKAGVITYKELSGRKSLPKPSVRYTYKPFTNVPQLKNLQAKRSGKKVFIQPMKEVITVDPGQYIGLQLPPGVYGKYLELHLNNPKVSQMGEVQVSSDGKKWQKAPTSSGGEDMRGNLDLKLKIQYMRYINTSKKAIEIKLDHFRYDVPNDAKIDGVENMSDGDINTFYTVKSGDTTIPNKAKPQAKQVYVMGSVEKLSVVYSNGNTVPYAQSHKIKNQTIRALKVKSSDSLRIREVIWK